MSDDGFHEIQLSGKQIVFLFMAATVLSVVIFLCGVLVGRGVQARRAAQAAADTSPLTLPEATVQPSTATGVAPAPGPAPAGGETLTYPQRLQGDTPPVETLRPGPAPPVAAEEPATSPPSASAEPGWVIQVTALRDRAAAQAIVRRLTERNYPAFLLEPGPGAPAPVYRVRVGRYNDRAEAEQVSRRLEREEQFKPLITR